ncbi:MAG: proline--tRNA ligase [Candidatus Improbicoccus pseudotrichonymphae]|uniref:Proline--tRNA ligase n=1 Tax=Candidatus Improbicoccus pseudotrichonymphae TaxID=3033792 RepID=A0AA48KZ52_9FIRM|nr:MAG: proline--tRNA ligase [Candidatus Improbicoccus pseudotrichonymphae]
MAHRIPVVVQVIEDFSKWYTDVLKKSELVDYSGVRGCVIMRPYACSMWENITSILDKRFKEIGVENVSMPMFIPESMLQKEKNHIEGFAPEVAWVTHGGQEELTERLCVRPTSEVMFCSHFSRIVNSWRDLPKLYNQWCSVVRWEKSSRPFLRSIEIHWQEGHTIHESPGEANDFSLKILNIYKEFLEEKLCIPLICGKKTESEKFAGAKITYTIECMMKDGKSLQTATSHYFGNEFTKVFNVKFQTKENKSDFAYYTSWGITTRTIGAIIMVHGDKDGLVLPPDVAPIQIIIIPIKDSNEVKFKVSEVFNLLRTKYRIKIDEKEESVGCKFANSELRGIPIRIEIGPRDISNNVFVLVRRDNRKKEICKFETILEKIECTINDIKLNLYNSALKRFNSNILNLNSLEEFEKTARIRDCFIKSYWCGSEKCENYIKDKFGYGSRCIPFEENIEEGSCIVCNKKCDTKLYWAKSY